MTAELIAAARHERDRRGKSYPQKIFNGQVSAEDATIDYQCWVAIAEWLETDRFFSFAGGANPDSPDAPIISWPSLEAAAGAALARTSIKIDAMEADPEQSRLTIGRRLTAGQWLERLEGLYLRRARLTLIHRKVAQMRGDVDMINRELRESAAA